MFRVAFLLRFVEIPHVLDLLSLGICGVNDGVGFSAVSHSSSFGVLAGGVDGVDDGIHQYGVTDDGLAIHDPNVHHAALWVYVVIGVGGVVL